MSDQDKRHLWNGKEPSYYVTGHAPQAEPAALPDLPTVPDGWKLVLENLLCRIHRDGGHYIAEHGIEKAVENADLRVAELNAMSDVLSAAPEPAQVSDKSSEAEQPRNEPVQQEPVTYSMTSNGKHTGNLYDNLEFAKERKAAMDMKWPDRVREIVPLYTSPQTQPMSDGQLNMFGHRIANQLGDVSPDRVQTIVRAVERFHKIGG